MAALFPNTTLNSLVSNTTLDPDVWDDILQHEKRELLLKLPAFLMLGIMMVLGLPGNIFVIIVYREKMKHSAYRVFVLCMAAFDLVNCLVGIPFEMVDLGNDVTLKNAGACKVFRFVITFCACGSVSILMAVSLERFRRVCHPLGFQISVKQSWILSAVSAFASLAFAVPALAFYGVKTDIKQGYRLYDCSIDDHWGTGSTAVFTYQIFLGILWIMCIFILAGVYIFIIYTIKKQNQKRLNLTDCSPLPGQPLVNFVLPAGEGSKHQTSDVNNHSSNLAGQDSTPPHQSALYGEETMNGRNAVGVQPERACAMEAGSRGNSQTPATEMTNDVDGSIVKTLAVAVNLGDTKADVNGGNERGAGDTAAFMRLFSRDVNPVHNAESPAQQKSKGFEPQVTVWEDEDQIQSLDDDQHSGIDSPGCAQGVQGGMTHLFARQESMNNYYSSAAQTPDGSQDGLSQYDPDDVQRLSCKKSDYIFRSWEAFNSSEGGGSFQTLNKSGSSEGIKPLAGNLQNTPRTCGFEMSVAAVELHYGGADKGETNTSMLSASKSCSALHSGDVSRRSSTSRAAQWGSLNALNSVDLSLEDTKDFESTTFNSEASSSKNVGDKPKFFSDLRGDQAREHRRQKLGHSAKSVRLCVSDDTVLGKRNINQGCVCTVHVSLPLLTEELRQEELGQFIMRRTMSVPSIPSLPEITSCGRLCRKKYAVRDLNETPVRNDATQYQRCSGNSSTGSDTSPDTSPNIRLESVESSLQATAEQVQLNGFSWKESTVDLQPVGSAQITSLSNDTSTATTPAPAPSGLCRRRTISSGPGREMLTTKLTYTMVAVTVGFIVSYLPHLIVQIGRGVASVGVESLLRSSPAFFVLYHLSVRTFFINNAINPIIYGFYNDTFRRKSVNLLKSWVVAALEEGRCGEKICPTRFRVWALRDFVVSSTHIEETG